jgi:phage baseplate assembly protein W
MTKKKERVMNLDFGCDIWKLTFDDDLLIIKELASEYVKDSLFKWEQRIEVYSVNVSKIEEKIFIDVTYRIKNNNETQNLRIETTIGGI